MRQNEQAYPMATGQAEAAQRAFLLRVYHWMTLGLALTALAVAVLGAAPLASVVEALVGDGAVIGDQAGAVAALLAVSGTRKLSILALITR